MKAYRITPLASRCAVLGSGGLDSSVMMVELARGGRRIFPLYVRSGLVWERGELAILRRFVRAVGSSRIEPVTVLRLEGSAQDRNHWSATGSGVPGYRAALRSNYLVGRNLGLLTCAALFCARNRIGEVAMASLGDNPFPDARPAFLRAFARAVELGLGLPLRVATPFSRLGKAEVIRRGAALPLELTLSCAHPRGRTHCGRCTKCAERIRAFRAAGVPDPTRYAPRG